MPCTLGILFRVVKRLIGSFPCWTPEHFAYPSIFWQRGPMNRVLPRFIGPLCQRRNFGRSPPEMRGSGTLRAKTTLTGRRDDLVARGPACQVLFLNGGGHQIGEEIGRAGKRGNAHVRQ